MSLSGGVAPDPLDGGWLAGVTFTRRLQAGVTFTRRLQAGVTFTRRFDAKLSSLEAWHLKALPPECNLPFDFATRYPLGTKEQLACSATLEHYLKIGSVDELPPETSDGLWSTFFPVPKKGTGKIRGCVDLRRPKSCI